MSTASSHIEMTAGVCGGKPRIAGHRIRVQDVVVWHEHLGMSPDEIVTEYPGITLSDVYAALTYYHDHFDDIQRDLEYERSVVESVKAATPSKLLKTLTHRDAADDTVSSR